MNKKHLVQRIAVEAGVTIREASAVVEAFENAVIDALSAGEDVRLAGLGTFQVKAAQPRAMYSLASKRIGWNDKLLLIRFQACERLRDAVRTAWSCHVSPRRHRGKAK